MNAATARQQSNRSRTGPGTGLGPAELERLESLLTDLENEHGALLELAGRHKDAVRQADSAELGRVVRETNSTLERIAHTEQTRRRLITQPDGSLPTVEQIASRVDAPHAKTLRARSKSLRSLMERVSEEHKAVRAASEALATHMQGLIEQVGSRLSHSGTYSPKGSVAPGRQQVVSGLDLVR